MTGRKGRSGSRDSSKGKGKGSSSSAGPKKKTCWQWQKGTCTFGNKCKFLHVDQSPSTASERSNKKTKKKTATPITLDSFFDSISEDDDGCSSPRIASAKKSSDDRRISLDMDPDMYVVEIDEYREGMPKRIYRDPNKPYVCLRTEEPTDEQSRSDNNTLGLRRARAIIMDIQGLHRDVDEVRIIIGPKFDMLIKLDGDREELNFTEDLVAHISEGKLRKTKNSMCISLPIQAKDRRFLLDSGSACDPIVFHTANGSTSTNTEAEVDLGTFDMTAQACILRRHSVRDVSRKTMHGRRLLVCMAFRANAFKEFTLHSGLSNASGLWVALQSKAFFGTSQGLQRSRGLWQLWMAVALQSTSQQGLQRSRGLVNHNPWAQVSRKFKGESFPTHYLP